MGMARQQVNMLVGFLLQVQEIGINAPSAFHAYRPVAHAVTKSKAVRQCGMHAHNNGAHIRIGLRALKRTFKPAYLVWRKLIKSSIIKVDEVHPTLNPVEICFRRSVLRIVRKPLLPERRGIQPFGEFFSKLLARFRRNEFMIANAHKDRRWAKSSKLVANKIIPGV